MSGICSFAFAWASIFAPVFSDHRRVAAGVVAVLVRVEDLRDFQPAAFAAREALLMVQRIDRQRLAGFGAGDQIVEVAIVIARSRSARRSRECPFSGNDLGNDSAGTARRCCDRSHRGGPQVQWS